MKVIKRDGRAVEYDREKIKIAIGKANNEVSMEERISDRQIENIIKYIESLKKKRMLVEDIQDIIEQKLMDLKKFVLAKEYIIYRYNRALVRKSNLTDESILSLIKNTSKNTLYKDTNKNNPTQRSLISSEVSKDLTKRILLPYTIKEEWLDGKILFHNAEYFIEPMIDSSHINLKKMLDNGLYLNNIYYEKPSCFINACFMSALILHDVSSNLYGTVTLNLDDIISYLSDDTFEIRKGVSLFFKLISSLKNSNGVYPTFDFYLSFESEKSKILNKYFLMEYLKYLENKIILNFKFEILFDKSLNKEIKELLFRCSSNNGCITYLSKEKELKKFSINFPTLDNCFIPFKNDEISSFILGKVSLNLVRIYKESSSLDDYFKELEETLELCKEALMVRYYAFFGTLSDTYKILYQDGAISRLKTGDKIDILLKSKRAYLILGYSGLSALDIEVSTKTLKIISEKITIWGQELNIPFKAKSLIDTSYFILKDKEKYGEVKDNLSYSNIEEFSYKDVDFFKKVLLKSKLTDILQDGIVFKIVDVPFHDETEMEKLIEFLNKNLYLFSLN